MSPSCMLVTGWACPADELQPLAAAMNAPADVVDFHAGGPVSPAWQPSHYARTLARRLKAHTQPVQLIGWSTGALIALEVAVWWPERIDSLVLLNGTARFTETAGYCAGTSMQSLQDLMAALESQDDCERALTRFMMQAALPGRLDHKTLRHRVAVALGLGLEPLSAGLLYLCQTDLRLRVPALRLPVTLLHGAQDAVVPVAAAQWLEQAIPRAQLHVEAGAGHDWPLRDPRRVAASIHQAAPL